MKALSLSLLSFCFFATAAYANPPAEVRAVLPAPAIKGQTTGNLFSVDIFDAQLFTANGAEFSWDRPFALTLEYRYDFSADLLAMASVREIARMEGLRVAALRPLRDQLKTCFRNVTEGERVTGVGRSEDVIEIYVNGTKTCALQQDNLRERFFSIWLGDSTRDPLGAARLKGRG